MLNLRSPTCTAMPHRSLTATVLGCKCCYVMTSQSLRKQHADQMQAAMCRAWLSRCSCLLVWGSAAAQEDEAVAEPIDAEPGEAEAGERREAILGD